MIDFNFVEQAFSRFFPDTYKLNDPNKDAVDKGTVERYVESISTELDILTPLIENLLQNILDPYQNLDKFIPYLESWLGNTVYPKANSLAIRRKVIQGMFRYYDKKGTIVGLESLLNVIRVDLGAIVEDFVGYSFDSPITFDDPVRVFDLGKCGGGCSNYSLELLTRGGVIIDNGLLLGIYSIIKFNHPINAQLISSTLDGVELTQRMLDAFVVFGGNPVDILSVDGFYTFVESGNILEDTQNIANLVVVSGNISLNL